MSAKVGINFETSKLLWKIFLFTNHVCQIIKLKTLATTDCLLFVMVLPGGKKQQLPHGASFHALSTRFLFVAYAFCHGFIWRLMLRMYWSRPKMLPANRNDWAT